MPREDTRCKWYNDQGHPRPNPRLSPGDLGCEFGSDCYYVHPDSPSWSTAKPSKPPSFEWGKKPRPKTPSPTRSLNQMPRRDRSPPIRLSRRRSRSRGDRDRSRTRSRDNGYRNHRRSPGPYSSKPPPQPSSSSSLDRRDSRDDNKGLPNAPRAIRRQSDVPLRDTVALIDRMTPSVPHSPLAPPPPIPTSVPPSPTATRTQKQLLLPLPKPRPPPIVSSSSLQASKSDPVVSSSKPSEKKEMTAAEKSNLWRDRVKLLADGVRADDEYQKQEATHREWTALYNTKKYRELGETVRSDFQKNIDEAQSKMNAAKKRYEEILDGLVATSFWPVISAQDMQSSFSETEREEMKRMVERMGARVHEMEQRLLQFNDTKRDVAALGNESADSRGAKRRRLSPPTEASTSALPIPAHAPEQSRPVQDIDTSYEERLQDIDYRIDDFENQLHGQEDDLADQFESKIDEKIDEKMRDFITQNTELRQEFDGRFGALETQYQALQNASTEHMDTESVLLLASRALQEQTAQIFCEQDAWKARWEDVEIQREKERNEISEMKKQLQDAIDEMRAKSALYHQSIKDPAVLSNINNLNTASAPDNASIEDIAAHLEPQIIEAVRRDIQPMMKELRLHIEHNVEVHTKDLYETLWPKLSFVFDVAKKIEVQCVDFQVGVEGD